MIFDLRDPQAVAVVQRDIARERARGQRIGLTSGTYDLVHFQHYWYFAQCREECDVLLVGVDSDRHVRERKGPDRPYICAYQRVFMVDGLKPVAFAFVMNGLRDLARVSELIRPDVLFRNDGYEGREKEVVGHEHAGRVVIIHDVHEYSSTTEIANAIAARLARSAPKS
jgi:D-beta-D-heptose 7-phosphate kinase/D-beta-D-heptose 1-phosphate adenosyltransferase